MHPQLLCCNIYLIIHKYIITYVWHSKNCMVYFQNLDSLMMQNIHIQVIHVIFFPSKQYDCALKPVIINCYDCCWIMNRWVCSKVITSVQVLEMSFLHQLPKSSEQQTCTDIFNLWKYIWNINSPSPFSGSVMSQQIDLQVDKTTFWCLYLDENISMNLCKSSVTVSDSLCS